MNKFSSNDSKDLSKTVKLYTDWVNRYLEKLGRNQWINVLQVDLCDGVLLADLITAVLNIRVTNIIKDPKNFTEQLHNVEVCLSFLKSQGVGTNGLKAKEIQHGSLKDILCLLYNLSEYKHKHKDSNNLSHQPQTTKAPPRAESFQSTTTPSDVRFHPRCLPVRQPSSSSQESSAAQGSPHPSATHPPPSHTQSHQPFDYSHCYSVVNISPYQKTSTQMPQGENEVNVSSQRKQNPSKLRGPIPVSSAIPSRQQSSSSGYATNSLGRTKAAVINNNNSNTAMSMKSHHREGSVPPSLPVSVQTGIPKPPSARSKTQSESEATLPVPMLGTGASNLDSSLLQKPSSKLSKLKMFSSKDSLDSRTTDDDRSESGKMTCTQKIPGYSISASNSFSQMENSGSHIPSSTSQSKLSLIIPHRSAASLPHHSATSSIPSGASSIPSSRLLPSTPHEGSRGMKTMREKSVSPRRTQKSPTRNADPAAQSRARDATSRQESNARRSSCSSTAPPSSKMPVPPQTGGSNIRPPSASRSAQSTAEKKMPRKTGIASAKTRQPKGSGIPAASSPSSSSVISMDSSVSSTSSSLPRNAKSAKGTKENFGSTDKLLMQSGSKTANAMKAVMLGASSSKSELKPPMASTKRSSNSSVEESLESTASLTRLPVAGCQKSLQEQKSSKSAPKISCGKSSLESLTVKGSEKESICPSTPVQIATDDANGPTKDTRNSRMPRYASQLPRGAQPGLANRTPSSGRRISDGVQPLLEKKLNEPQRKPTLDGSQEDVNNNQNDAFTSDENVCNLLETKVINSKLDHSKYQKTAKKLNCVSSGASSSDNGPPVVDSDSLAAQGWESPQLRTDEVKNTSKSKALHKNSSSAAEDLDSTSATSSAAAAAAAALENAESESTNVLNHKVENKGLKSNRRKAFVMDGGIKESSKQQKKSTNSEENSESENLSAFEVKPMEPITRCVPLSGGLGGFPRGQNHRRLPTLPSHNRMLYDPSFPPGQRYFGTSDDSLNMGVIDAEAGYMSDGDFLFGSSHLDRLNCRFVNNDGMLHYKQNHHSVEEIPNAWKRNKMKAESKDDDSFDDCSSVSSDEIKEAIASSEIQKAKRLEVRTGSPCSTVADGILGEERKLETPSKTPLPGDAIGGGFLKRGLVERTTLPSRGKRAILPVSGFVKKSQQQVTDVDSRVDRTRERDSSFAFLDLPQVNDKKKSAAAADSEEMLRPSVDRSINSQGDLAGLEDQKGDKPDIYFKHMNTLPRSHDRPNVVVGANAAQSDEQLLQLNLTSSFPSSISSNSMFGQLKAPSHCSSMERRYGSLGRRGMTLGAKDASFGGIGKTGGSSIIQDGGQSFFSGAVISNPLAVTGKIDPGGRQYLLNPERKASGGVELFDFHDYADLARSAGLSKRRISNPATGLNWTRTDASIDAGNHAYSDTSNTLGTPLRRSLRSQYSIDSSLDNVRSKTPFECTGSLHQVPPLMSESLSRRELSKQPSSLSQSSSHRSGLAMSSDNILHGSSLSLGSNSSMYSTAEELQAQEIRKLRQDLEFAQAKVSTLNMQVSTNEHVICAFEQSLTSMTHRLQDLAAITDKKDSEVRELRNTIDMLRQQTRINSSASSGHLTSNIIQYDETDPHFAVDTISCSGSIGQLSNSSDGDRKKKQKNWFASIGKALNRKKNKSGSLLDQDLDGSGSGESLSQISTPIPQLPLSMSVPSTPIRSSASDAILTDAHSKKDPLTELEKQLHEKEMKLTDVQLEALTSAHQLEQMRNNMTRMKNEILYLKADNDRMQNMMSQKGIQTPTSSPSPLQREGHRISLECPANLEILLGNDGNREAPKITLSVNLNQQASDCSPGQELKPQTVLIGRLAISEKTNWENLNRIVCGKFKEYCFSLDPDSGLGLSGDSVKSFSIGEMTWCKGVELPELLPCGYLVGDNLNISLLLRGVDESRTDSLAFETLIPKSIIQRYVTLLTDHRRIILNGPSGTGKTYLARKLAEYLVLRSGKKLTNKSVSTYNVDHKSNKELRQYLSNIGEQCEQGSADLPSVIILDNLHHVASLGEVFDGFLSVRNRASPYMIGTMNHVTGSTTDLQLHHNFRWVLCANHVEPVQGFLGRYLRRRLIEDRAHSNDDVCTDMDSIIEWLPKVWQHLNRFLETHSCREVTIGPRLFLSCPMSRSAVQTWFIDLWNYSILPYMMEAVREGIQSYGCRAPWEDPAETVIKTCPWNQSPDEWTSLLRLRPEDVGYDGQMTPTTAGNSKIHPIAQADSVTTDPLLKLNMLLRLQDAANSAGTVGDNDRRITEKVMK